MELISLKGVPRESKIELLRQLGYDSDGTYVLKDGSPVVDENAGARVTLDNMAILPGSAVVVVDSALSFATYFEEHGDWD
jgi:hypothetical protein